jgi:hypothetical protein
MALAVWGANDKSGQVIDECVLVPLIRRYITSPFLNRFDVFEKCHECIHNYVVIRRLWGLKLLTELVKRTQLSIEWPDGFKISRSAISSEDASKSPNAPHLENVHYRVVRVSLKVTVSALCRLKFDFIAKIFLT